MLQNGEGHALASQEEESVTFLPKPPSTFLTNFSGNQDDPPIFKFPFSSSPE